MTRAQKMKNFENAIEELKDLVLDLHRSAGNLDDIIRVIECQRDTLNDDEMVCYLSSQHSYRGDIKKYRSFDNFENRENEAWQKLIKSLREGT